MDTFGLDLAALIHDLAEIDSEGQLGELVGEHSRACRGQPLDHCRLFTAGELLRAQAVSRALAQLFDLPAEACKAAARDVLLPHPRRTAARELIADYVGRDGAMEKLAAQRRRSIR